MDERGFTLVEILVTILIVGLLAALALPAFLGQSAKAHDANAKADVRNAVSQMEACHAEPETYGPCPDDGHPLAGDVTLAVDGGGEGYVVSKLSSTGTTFTIDRSSDGYARICTQPAKGGCRADSSW